MQNSLRHTLAACLLLACAGMALAAASVTVTSVCPDKLVYGFSAPGVITVTINNTLKEAHDVELKVFLGNRLAHEVMIYDDQLIEMAAKETKVIKVPFTTGKKADGAEYGYEARAVITDLNKPEILFTDPEPGTIGREYFMVTDNPVKIGHMTIPTGMCDHREGLGGLQNGIERSRASYVSVFETAFWAPCDFSELTTDREFWTSGQAGRYNSLQGMKAISSAVHALGGQIVIYADKWACGPVGFENARKHPEWYHWGQDWYGCKFDVETLDWIAEPTLKDGKWKEHAEGGIWAICPLVAKPAVAQFGIEQLTGSMKEFGWDGVRFDNAGWTVDDVTDIEGNAAVPHGKDSRKLEAELIGQIKAAGRKVNPHFVYGDNVEWCDDLAKATPKWLAEAADGGLMMSEGMRSTTHPGSSLNNWAYLREHLHKSIPTVRQAGGYPYGIIFPAQENEPVRADGAILYAVLMASGMHIFGTAPENYHPYMRLYARYCDLLYDDKLQFITNPEPMITVNSRAPIWWKDYVRRRDLPDGTSQFIVHLINPSTGERIATGEGFSGKTNPAPEVQKNIEVSFTPPAGMKVTQAQVITADSADGPVVKSPGWGTSNVNPTARINVSELRYWDVVVIEAHR